MKDTVQTLVDSLETVIRYIAPGFVLVLASFLVTDPQTHFFLSVVLLQYPWLVILGASMAGLVVSGVHSSLFEDVACYIVTGRLWTSECPSVVRYRKSVVPDGKELPLVTSREAVFMLTRERWMRKGSTDPQVQAVQRSLATLGSMLTFLFCASYPTILVGVVGLGLSHFGHAKALESGLVLLAGVVLLFFAFCLDARYTRFDLWAACRFPQGDLLSKHLQ